MSTQHKIDIPGPVPFDTRKDFVILGRGDINRDRFYFNLNQVNVFYLNYQPVQWVWEHYKRSFPKHYRNSLFSFIHASHTADFLNVDEYRPDIITWNPGYRGIKQNNVSIAALSYLNKILKWKTIYLAAFDFIERLEWKYKIGQNGEKLWYQIVRSFHQEIKHMRGMVKGFSLNKFVFVTPTRGMEDFFPVSKSHEWKERLKQNGTIEKELTDKEIEKQYRKAKIEMPLDPGVLIRRKELQHRCESCLHVEMKPIRVDRKEKYLCRKKWELINGIHDVKDCWE